MPDKPLIKKVHHCRKVVNCYILGGVTGVVLGQGTPRVSVRKEIRSWQEENKIPGSYMSFYLPLIISM